MAFATSCAKQQPAAILASADDALSITDYRTAQSLLDNLADIARADSTALLPSQYCRLALDYMILTEHQSESTSSTDDNVTIASAMFNAAISISPDSVQAFLDELPPEESGHAALLVHLSEAAEARDMILGEFEEPDSITDNTHDHEHEIQ